MKRQREKKTNRQKWTHRYIETIRSCRLGHNETGKCSPRSIIRTGRLDSCAEDHVTDDSEASRLVHKRRTDRIPQFVRSFVRESMTIAVLVRHL